MTTYYCSLCGVELTHLRQAIKGKGFIADLIEPHECEGYAIEANVLGKPTLLDKINELNELGSRRRVGDYNEEDKPKGFFSGDGDKRKDKITTTAPRGVIDSVKSSMTSEPEGSVDE